MHLNHPHIIPPHPAPSMEKLSSMKPVPGAKKGWGLVLNDHSSHQQLLLYKKQNTYKLNARLS